MSGGELHRAQTTSQTKPPGAGLDGKGDSENCQGIDLVNSEPGKKKLELAGSQWSRLPTARRGEYEALAARENNENDRLRLKSLRW